MLAIVDLGTGWQTLKGTLVLPEDTRPMLSMRRPSPPPPRHTSIDRLLLYPDDAIDGADPDIIRMLREAHLPSSVGPAATSSRATIGAMASGRSMHAQPCPILRGKVSSSTSLAQTSSSLSAVRWAASR